MSKYLLALNAHQKIGSQTLKKALAAFDENPERIWNANSSEIEKKLGPKISAIISEAKKNYSPEKEEENLIKSGIGYITESHKDYPPLLKEMPDAPAILYVKGNIKALKSPGIAVVGSRKFTHYGKSAAYSLSKECADAGLSVISGLAFGIDTFAHRGALDSGGVTVGVLGCGLLQIYPASNVMLAKEIVEKGGALVSELSPYTPPLKHNFPVRNRIIAGLALGTLVIEAAEQSGALITAFCSLEYNREVFAIPGNIDSETSVGTNLLIQNGAKLVLSIDDITSELNIKKIKSTDKAKEISPESEEEKTVLGTFKNGEASADEIIKLTKINVIRLNSILTLLEMKGILENVGGGRYRKKI